LWQTQNGSRRCRLSSCITGKSVPRKRRRATARLGQDVAVPGTGRRHAVGDGALALAAVLGLAAAGCGNSGGHSAATGSTSTSSAPCKLNRAQRRTVDRRSPTSGVCVRIQAMQTFCQRGAPNQEVLTGKFELDLGSTHLPLNVFSHLLHLAKTAVSLCGDRGNALEADEPGLGNNPAARTYKRALPDNAGDLATAPARREACPTEDQ
jgi:hypothetical protein